MFTRPSIFQMATLPLEFPRNGIMSGSAFIGGFACAFGLGALVSLGAEVGNSLMRLAIWVWVNTYRSG